MNNKPISEVYNCDCMEFMKDIPDKFYDLAIVDPPYGIGDTRQTAGKLIHKKIIWNNKIPSKKYFDELRRISINQIIWGANYYGKYIKSTGRIIHDKTEINKNTHRFKELSDCDIASHSFGVNIKKFHFTWIGNVQGNKVNWDNNGLNGRIHPQQKPVELYRWLLKNYAKQGDKIFDSHMGSQSSRIAAYDMGFDYWGCEIDEDYFRDSCKRFEIFKAQQVIKFNK